MEAKKSFLLYFDNYPMVACLPAEQRGWLLTALYAYAFRLTRSEETTMEQLAREFPAMTEETRMACNFMCASIKRDTQRWLNQREGRIRKKAQREEQGSHPISEGEKLRRDGDIQRMRRDMLKCRVVE